MYSFVDFSDLKSGLFPGVLTMNAKGGLLQGIDICFHQLFKLTAIYQIIIYANSL